MAVKKTLSFDIYGKDKNASKTMRDVGKSADSLGKRMSKVGAGIAAGLAVAGAAAIAFGVDSVKAFAEAEKSQNDLRFALEKFPKAADTNIKALGKLNTALMKKTRFDDDAIASAQSVLLQYELTGKQLEELSPLLLDFAAKTGQDLPAAAEALGKALLGQGRALKDVGIDFVDTGTVAGNFDQIVAGLRQQVGGFAEQDAQTASGKLEQLRNRFGEVQEKIGAALMPTLMEFADWLEGDGAKAIDGLTTWIVEDAIPGLNGLVDWVVKWKDELGLVTVAIGAATFAQGLLNGAMAANPIGIVVTALILASAWIIHVMNNFEDMRTMMLGAASNVALWFLGMARGFNNMVGSLVNGFLNLIRPLVEAVNPLREFFGMGSIRVPTFVPNNSIIDGAIANATRVAGSGTSGGSGGSGGARMMATGGIVRASAGGTAAVIGEGGNDEAVIPLSKPALAKYGIGGGDGSQVVVNMTGLAVGTTDELAQKIVRMIDNAKRSGAVPSKRFA